MIHRRLMIAVVTIGLGIAQAAPTARPNILFILTDDQGWPTLGCYGSKAAPTPHLDKLAGEGVRFTDAYAMPQCTPTRAALLTGQHTARNGMWHVLPWYGLPWARMQEPAFREQLPRDMPNLPRTLHAAGYKTGMAGKWHLTTNTDGDYASLKPQAGPAYGFDYVAPRGPGSQNEGDKWVDHLTGAAIGFIREHRENPWFFYLAHHTLHSVISAPENLVKKCRDRGAPDEGLFNARYLAAIEHMDNSIGRLMATLDELKLRENTLVVFMSDNGGFDTNYDPPGLRGVAADGREPLKINEQNFDNAPLRSGKGSAYEGGLRVPCIVRWPSRVKAAQTCTTPVHVVDWMPTLMAAADVAPPVNHVVDGVNVLPLMQGASIPARPLYWYMPLYDLRWAATPCAVIRDGDWKLIESFGDWYDEEPRYHQGRRIELYNLARDLGETQDLSAAERDRAQKMTAQLHAWLQGVPAVIPGANPHFDAKRMLEETKVKQPWNP